MTSPRASVVCLLPVRNGAQDLLGYLEAAPTWCDAIVALDDGSTDDTRELLEASPLVRIVLENPRRDSFEGWHDGRNRARLLEAAGELAPDWIVSVDADELIQAEDAAALRTFLSTDALPGIAYGFRHLRMWGDEADPSSMWVYRLFAWRATYRFPDEPLHFSPVPTDIPRQAWVRTSIRLQHLASQTEDRRRARLAKYAEADPAHEYRTNFGGLDEVPRRLELWTPRDPDEPIVVPRQRQLGVRALLDEAGRGRPVIAAGTSGDTAAGGAPGSGAAPDPAEGVRIVCLLPARNCVEDLPGWFDSVRAVADAVVALDDGSTDETRAVLKADPLVRVLLTRPKRPDYREWDDAANRQALLDAAAELRPEWVLSLDADERIDAADAAALRSFLAEGGEALPGFAYGFRVFRMVGDLQHFDRAELVAYRLFAWREGLTFRTQRLHLVPVPDVIPPERYLPTTVRIQHLAGLTEQRRRERFAKYREADPELAFQADYGHLLSDPEDVKEWEPRPADLPVLSLEDATGDSGDTGDPGEPDDGGEPEFDPDAPVLSAIVISRDDEDRIERVVRSVVTQEVPEPFEVIVVVSGTDRTGEIVREEFPDVTLIELDRPALPGEARNAGLSVASGDYVSFPGSHVTLPPGSLAARVRAHEQGWPMVTGSTLNATKTPSGWASYLLDHASVLPGRPSGELDFAPPHCSYDREFLLRTGGFPEDMRAGEDTVVNMMLFYGGYKAYRAADVTLFHESPCTTPDILARHHFQRGRALGRIMLRTAPAGGRVLDRDALGRVLLRYVPDRLAGIARNVERYGGDELRAVHRNVRPLIALGTLAAWAGTWFELLRPWPGKLRRLVGTPAVNVAIGGLDRRGAFKVGRTDVLLLARIEPFAGRARLLSLPRDLLVEIPGAGKGRLNEAYFHGASGGSDPRAATAVGEASTIVRDDPAAGMRELRATLQETLQIPIHGSVIADFNGFAELIDALGGVEVNVPQAIDDEFVGEDGETFSAHFAAGRQSLGGQEALTYARTRMADGDRWRRQRHLDLVSAVLRAIGAIRSLGQLVDVARAALGAIRTDLGPVRLVAAGIGLLRARSGRRLKHLHASPPVVRSERIDLGWVHVTDGDLLTRFVRDALVLGKGDGRGSEEGAPNGAELR